MPVVQHNNTVSIVTEKHWTAQNQYLMMYVSEIIGLALQKGFKAYVFGFIKVHTSVRYLFDSAKQLKFLHRGISLRGMKTIKLMDIAVL